MRSLLKNIFLTLLATLAMLALVEMLARIAGTIDQDISAKQAPASEQWMGYSPMTGWERQPNYKGMAGLAYRQFDAAGYFTVDSKQATATTGKKKVVFFGDSNTFGYGVPTSDSFVEITEGLLPGIEAINLGVIGYSSFQGRVTLEKYLPILKPDLVVISFNFNDRRYATPPDEQDGLEEFQRVYRSSKSIITSSARFLEVSYLFRGLRRLMRKAGLIPESIPNVRVTDLKPRVNEDAYRENLSLIAAKAERLGIPVLFVLLRDNPVLSDHLRKGIASLEKHDYDMAIAYLNSAAGSRTMFSELARVYLVRAYEAKADKAQAAEAAVVDTPYRSLTGGALIRLDADYNEIMRQVAAEYGAPLLDGAAVLEKHPYVFIDFCHFNSVGHRLLGEHLAAQISEILETKKTGKSH